MHGNEVKNNSLPNSLPFSGSPCGGSLPERKQRIAARPETASAALSTQ
ncbi:MULTISPECIES: hypothetical protein [Eikenella]|nr:MULTISPECIES: hypothetical protein [Eikenella]